MKHFNQMSKEEVLSYFIKQQVPLILLEVYKYEFTFVPVDASLARFKVVINCNDIQQLYRFHIVAGQEYILQDAKYSPSPSEGRRCLPAQFAKII